MLKTRIITAVLLFLAVLFALCYLSPTGWVLFSTLIVSVAAWEWGGLMAFGRFPRFLLGGASALISFVIAYLEPAALGLGSDTEFSESAWRLARWFYVPAAVFWLLIAPLWMKYRWVLPKSTLGVATGAVIIFPTWLAFVQLRQLGVVSLVAIVATVWVADMAAYFFGKAFGRRKLAPSISPGKTWEGAVGSGFAVIVYGFLFLSELPAKIAGNHILLFFALALLTVISIVGDLFESLLKRQAGLKDSSHILPGHGGVLDRIDSLTSTLPLIALVWLIASH